MQAWPRKRSVKISIKSGEPVKNGIFVVFIIAFVYLGIVQFSSPTIVEPSDSFYHIKMAELMRYNGPIKNFPWLQYCTIGKERFVDFDFIFHILLIPFTFLGLTTGAKLAAVVFSTAIITVLYYIIDKKNLPFPLLWALSIFASGNCFMIRLTFPRGYLIGIPLSLLAVYFITNKNYKALFFLTVIYTLSYTSVLLVLLYALAFFCGYKLLKEKFPVSILYAAFGGWAVGLIIHPNFPNIVKLLWSRVFAIFLLNWAGVNLGTGAELLPLTTREFIMDLGYVASLLGVIIYMVIINNKKISADSLSLLIITTILSIATFMSKRMVEYSVPFAILTCAFLSADLLGVVRAEQMRNLLKKRQWRFGVTLIAALFAIFSISTFRNEWNALAGKSCFSIGKGASWLNDNSQKGDVVFNCSWDDFPQLFFYSPKTYCLVGMDPTYFYIYDRALWEKWMRSRTGRAKDTYDIIKNDFHAKWVFSTTRKNHDFINYAATEPRLERVYADNTSVIYKVK